ncbi:MAG: hypothetical protein HAW60_00965 [Bdellovibrionales bacterium]|nr:hypothetical protein [Bdellovibrionales bacterium]
MKNLLLIFSLIISISSNYGMANTTDSDFKAEAQSCSDKECLNLSSQSNANNSCKHGSKTNDISLAKSLSKNDDYNSHDSAK